MRFRRPFLYWITLALLAYTQVTLAVVPCVSANATPASAFGEMPEDCAMQTEANLCLAHCQAADRSGAQTQVIALPVLDAVVLWLPYRSGDLPGIGHLIPPGERRLARPPPLALLCSLNL